MPEKPSPPAYPSSDTNKFFMVFFALTIVFVLASSFYLYLDINNFNKASVVIYRTGLPFSRISEIFQNIKLLFQGYLNGYARSLIGFVIFGMLATFFISIGKLIVISIFGKNNDENSGLYRSTLLERVSLYYILGSLVGSLLWLGMGMAGFLNFGTALTTALLGFLIFYLLFLNSKEIFNKLSIYKYVGAWWRQYSLIEKILSLLLLVILLFISTTAVRQPRFSDSLFSHLVLANFYINEGKIVTNPYHYYTYFTQNTEMLVMWALLLKSIFAAGLLIWGFLVAFLFLIWGFLKRYTTNFVALITVFVVVSATPVILASTMIKPDLPAGLFIFAHYYAMIEGFNRYSLSQQESKRWFLLSGILCGGAIGYKLIALPTILFSILIIFATDLYYKKKHEAHSLIIFSWVIGLLIAVSPWFLRNFWETRNPFYPFLGDFFRSNLPDTFYKKIENPLTANIQIGMGLKNYFYNLIKIPQWGPVSLLGLLAIPSLLKKSFPIGFKLCLGAAILTIAFLVLGIHPMWLETRNHIGLLTFIVAVPFALHFDIALKQRMKTLYTLLTVGMIMFCYYLIYLNSKTWKINTWNFKSSFNVLMSGNSLGNYVAENDSLLDNMNWMNYIINTRTKKNESVLLAGIEYAYGLNRKMFLSSSYNNEMICEMAKNSSDAIDLKNKLQELKIDHILIKSYFFDYFKNHQIPELRMQESDLRKIKELINQHMFKRFWTPDEMIVWYSFKGGDGPKSVDLNRDDAQEFPTMFMQEARRQFERGNMNVAQQMMEIAIRTPMSVKNKLYAYNFLVSIYIAKGEKVKAEETLIAATNFLPNVFETYINLAIYYDEQRMFSKAIGLYEKALELHPNDANIYNDLGNIYFQVKDYYKSLQFYKKVVELNPDHFAAYNNLGNIHYVFKKYNEALQFYRKAIELNPLFAMAYNNIGLIFHDLRIDDQALQFYNKAIEVDPNCMLAYQNLARFWKERKEYKKAEQIDRKILQVIQSSPK